MSPGTQCIVPEMERSRLSWNRLTAMKTLARDDGGMKRSTAISRLSEIADGLERSKVLSGPGVIAGYVFGGLLDPAGDARPRGSSRRRARTSTSRSASDGIMIGSTRVSWRVCSGHWRDLRPRSNSLEPCSGPGGGIGRRGGLKPPWPQGHAGSNPAPGTKKHQEAP
jgi:hypothetical protein